MLFVFLNNFYLSPTDPFFVNQCSEKKNFSCCEGKKSGLIRSSQSFIIKMLVPLRRVRHSIDTLVS